MLRNLFVDRLRRRSARREVAADPARLVARASDAQAWWEQLDPDELERALAVLPAGQRTALRLFAFEGKRYDEIARLEGISMSTVGTRILRARHRLRALLAAAAAPPTA